MTTQLTTVAARPATLTESDIAALTALPAQLSAAKIVALFLVPGALMTLAFVALSPAVEASGSRRSPRC